MPSRDLIWTVLSLLFISSLCAVIGSIFGFVNQ